MFSLPARPRVAGLLPDLFSVRPHFNWNAVVGLNELKQRCKEEWTEIPTMIWETDKNHTAHDSLKLLLLMWINCQAILSNSDLVETKMLFYVPNTKTHLVRELAMFLHMEIIAWTGCYLFFLHMTVSVKNMSARGSYLSGSVTSQSQIRV